MPLSATTGCFACWEGPPRNLEFIESAGEDGTGAQGVLGAKRAKRAVDRCSASVSASAWALTRVDE